MNIKQKFLWSIMFNNIIYFSKVNEGVHKINNEKNINTGYDDMKNTEDKIDALEKQLKEKNDNLERIYQNKITASKKYVENLEKQVANMENALNEKKALLRNIENKINNKLEKLKEEKKNYEKEINEIKTNIENLKKVNKDDENIEVTHQVESMMEKLNNKINQYKYIKNMKSAKIYSLKIKQDGIKSYIRNKEGTINRYKNKIKNVFSKIQNKFIEKKNQIKDKFMKKITNLKNYLKEKNKNVEIPSPIVVKK